MWSAHCFADMDETLVMTAEADEQAYLEVAALAKQLVPKVSMPSQLSSIATVMPTHGCALKLRTRLRPFHGLDFLDQDMSMITAVPSQV
jgi:hypothetical protein